MLIYMQFDPGGFLDDLGAAIQQALLDIINALIYIVQLLQAVFIYLFNLLVSIVNGVVAAFKVVATGFVSVLKDIWENVLQPFLGKINQFLTWLKGKLNPVLKYLLLMRKAYDKYFNLYVKPVLNIMQRIRMVLKLFKLFHVKWATVLDNWIANIQARIIHNFEVIRQRTNEIISWVDLVVDPYGLLRRGPLAQSVGAALGDIVSGITGHPLSFYEVKGNSNVGAPSVGQSFASTVSDMTSQAGGGSGFWADTITDGNSWLNSFGTGTN